MYNSKHGTINPGRIQRLNYLCFGLFLCACDLTNSTAACPDIVGIFAMTKFNSILRSL